MSAYFFVAQHGMSQCVSSLPPSAGNFFSDTGIGFFFIRLGFFFYSVGSRIFRKCSVGSYSVFSKMKKIFVCGLFGFFIFLNKYSVGNAGLLLFNKNVWLVSSFYSVVRFF